MNEEAILSALRAVDDPELGVSIVELGLVDRVLVNEAGILVHLLLTSPLCPLGGYMRDEATTALRSAFPEVLIEVRLIRDVAWTPERMSAAARSQLGWGEGA